MPTNRHTPWLARRSNHWQSVCRTVRLCPLTCSGCRHDSGEYYFIMAPFPWLLSVNTFRGNKRYPRSLSLPQCRCSHFRFPAFCPFANQYCLNCSIIDAVDDMIASRYREAQVRQLSKGIFMPRRYTTTKWRRNLQARKPSALSFQYQLKMPMTNNDVTSTRPPRSRQATAAPEPSLPLSTLIR